MVIGIAGLGLMGGAIASALREKCEVAQDALYACDSNPDVLRSAEQAGLIAKGYEPSDVAVMLSFCDVVFLCLNPSTLIRFTEQHEGEFKSGAVLTDIAGVKKSIAAFADKLRPDIDFIPGHPMAGSEKGGFVNSNMVNFSGKNYILTPIKRNKPENVAFIKELIYRMGFGRITETTAADHDSKIAFTSQLCHIIAASLIDCEADTAITRFGGGSFEDLTRIAMLNAPMWTELFLENSELLLNRVESFEKSLDEIKALIKNGRADVLKQKLELVRNRRAAMN